VAAVGVGFVKYRPGGINFDYQSVFSSAKKIDFADLGGKLSQGLDTLVTHPGRSPVILGIEITNDSLKTVADTLSGLPPDQLQQIKQFLCQPATPSAE
jgi:hypothetical protein